MLLSIHCSCVTFTIVHFTSRKHFSKFISLLGNISLSSFESPDFRMDSTGHMKRDTRDFDLNIPLCSESVIPKESCCGKVEGDLDLNVPLCFESSIGDDDSLSSALQTIPLEPVIHRRKRSTLNRQPRHDLRPLSPPRLEVNSPYATPSMGTVSRNPSLPSAIDCQSPAAVFSSEEIEELSMPIKYLKNLKSKKGTSSTASRIG